MQNTDERWIDLERKNSIRLAMSRLHSFLISCAYKYLVDAFNLVYIDNFVVVMLTRIRWKEEEKRKFLHRNDQLKN